MSNATPAPESPEERDPDEARPAPEPSPEPAWSLTDQALVIILHAENDIVADGGRRPSVHRQPSSGASRRRARAHFSASFSEVNWLRESAVMRLVTTVESYTDAVSNFSLHRRGLPQRDKPIWSWDNRQDYYGDTHGFKPEDCAKWEEIEAGIDLRNALAHGLGALTKSLLDDDLLFQRQRRIDVDVHGGRMYTRASTVPILAYACRQYVLDLEKRLVQKELSTRSPIQSAPAEIKPA